MSLPFVTSVRRAVKEWAGFQASASDSAGITVLEKQQQPLRNRPNHIENHEIKMAKLADLIWKNAELLRGAFKENECRKIILPFTILRRLDCVLAPTCDAVRTKYEAIKDKGYDLDKFLTRTSGYPFFNTSRFTLPGVVETPDGVRDNLEAMINGFSQNVRDIFEKFGFIATIDKLAEKNRLFLVTQCFAETDLRATDENGMAVVTNHDMGQAFEELLRKFNDVSLRENSTPHAM